MSSLIYEIPTHPALASTVEAVFCLTGYSPEHATERLVPDGRAAIVIELDGRSRRVLDRTTGVVRTCSGAWVSGVNTHPVLIEVHRDAWLVGVKFSPGRAFPTLRRPLFELNDGHVPASEVFGRDVLDLRNDLLALVGDAESLLERVSRWLQPRVAPGLMPPAELLAIVDRIVAAPTVATLNQLIGAEGPSRKHLAALFKKYVGPTPKVLQSILRFQQTIERVRARLSVDWAELSVECGFSDQSHFIREFRRFSGYVPSEFAALGTRRPNFFPEERTG